MKVIYSKSALISLQEIVEFLQLNWTSREIKVLNDDIEKFLKSIEDRIIVYPSSDYDLKLKVALIGKKQVKVFFELRENRIDILLFWHCKQNPEKLKYLLKR